MKTIKEMKEHFQNLVNGKAVYVWGANCEVISKNTIDVIYNKARSSTYNRNYYDAKLKEGKGRIAADCSGSFYPLSGYDTTANGYYNKCYKKGTIDSLPKTTPCMLFIKQSGKMTHIGWYDGKGKVYEMRSSQLNVRYDALDTRWTHYGLPTFVDYAEYEKEQREDDKVMIELTQLNNGDEGAQVKTLQRLLNALGYSCGKVDGAFGSKTLKAVKSFQKKNNLTQDGIVGLNTWTALLK